MVKEFTSYPLWQLGWSMDSATENGSTSVVRWRKLGIYLFKLAPLRIKLVGSSTTQLVTICRKQTGRTACFRLHKLSGIEWRVQINIITTGWPKFCLDFVAFRGFTIWWNGSYIFPLKLISVINLYFCIVLNSCIILYLW